MAILFSMKRKERLRPDVVRWLAFGAAFVILQWIIYWTSYRTPVPISFLIKSVDSPYSAEALSQYGFGNLLEAYQLLRSNSIQIALCSFIIVAAVTKCQRLAAWEWGLAGGMLAFLVFCLLGNRVPVTAGGARFLVPAIPVIVYFSAKAAYRLSGRVGGGEGLPAGRTLVLVALACAAAVQAPPAARALAKGVVLPAIECRFRCWGPTARRDALYANAKSQGKWEALLTIIGSLPKECSIADTEVGAIGAIEWQRPLFDYSGLNYLDLARRRNAVERLFGDRPDFVYLDRITWYWSITGAEKKRLVETFTPVGAVHGRETLYVRRSSDCPANLGVDRPS
jgi:hypothetical protein